LNGVLAGQHSSLRATHSSAKGYAKSYHPCGKISLEFAAKAQAKAWVTFNIDDPNSSDTASVGADPEDCDIDEDVKPRARRGGSMPLGRLHTSTEPLFDLVSQGRYVGIQEGIRRVEGPSSDDHSGGGGTLHLNIYDNRTLSFVKQWTNVTGSFYESPDESHLIVAKKEGSKIHVFHNWSRSALTFEVDAPVAGF
jgi:hypothetical protein